MNPLTMKSWSPYVVGVAIGLLSWLTMASSGKLLGISTPFEQTGALVTKAVAPSAADSNCYYADKAASKQLPKVGWEWMLVLGVFLGAGLSSWLSGDRATQTVEEPWRSRFGGSVAVRMAAAVGGGLLMILGARLAGGCTSGHAISGSLQLAVSSWIFVLTFFAAGIITAFVLYRTGDRRHG